jgi:hypothetical protein
MGCPQTNLRYMAREWATVMNWMLSSPWWEKTWPWGGTLIVLVVWAWCGRPFPSSPDALFGASATVASVFASFLGVSKAIILTIKGTKTYQILEQKGYTPCLFRYLRAGIFASVLFSTMSILGFFIDREKSVADHNLYSMFSAAWIASGALSLLTYLRISNILFKLLKIS